MNRLSTKKMSVLGMLTALSFLFVFLFRIPVLPATPFLKYEPKDVIILIAGFLYGPLSLVMVSFLVSFLELITFSATGWIGFVMNVLSTVSFALPSALMYRERRNSQSVLFGLIMGSAAVTFVMMLWNYFLTPFFMNIPREKVVPLLTSAILPFNLLKSAINASLAMILYKPVVGALRRAGLIEQSTTPHKKQYVSLPIAVFILVSCILFIMVLNGWI